MFGSVDGRATLARARKLLLNLGLYTEAGGWRRRRELRLFCLTAIVALGGCASGGSAPQTSMAPMFPESKWGVSASRRVASLSTPIPKGGGVYKIGDPYQVGGQWFDPREQPDYDRVGIASWYGTDFHGRHTANGEIYDMNALTAAHPTLPIPSFAYVTNLANGRTILLRINDRGPYVADRVIDLSQRSARELGLERGGTGRVRVKYAGRAPLDGNDSYERQFLASRPWSGAQRFAEGGAQRFAESGAQRFAESGAQRFAESGAQRFAESGGERLADAGMDAAPPPPPRSYAPASSPQRSYTSQDWSPPVERTSAARGWSPDDATAAAPRTYGATQGWSPAAYRAGLAAR
jgi:rare lipoprotein A